MLILGISGSPNPKGNTAYMLNMGLAEAERRGAETRLIIASEALDTCATPFCVSCASPCDGRCMKGTKMEEVVSLVRRADGILFGSPVYFGSMSAQFKAFFDKLRHLRAQYALLNTVGGVMAVGHSQYGGEEQAMSAMRDALFIYGMTVVGSTHAEVAEGHGGVGLTAPAEGNANAEQKMRALSRRVVQVAEATAGLRKRG